MIDPIKKIAAKKSENFPATITYLVLDDMDNLRQQMISDLRKLGVTGPIFEAASVQMAIDTLAKEKIEFIFSDWNLPDGNGHDLLKKVRSIERYKKTPFIMWTTNTDINFFLEAISSGANDYLVKPWAIEELNKKILLVWENFLNKK